MNTNENQMPTGFSTMTSAIAEAHNYNNWIVDNFKSYITGDFLEVGIGFGNFKEKVQNQIESYAGVDIEEELIRQEQKKDVSASYYAADVSSSDFISIFEEEFKDSILMVNVLEHVDNDRLALENLLSILKPHGHLLLFIPAFMALYNDMDRLAGHHRRYTKRSLKSILPKQGVQIVKLEYFNPIGALGWWVNKFKSHTNLDSQNLNTQTEIFDKYLVPVSKAINVFTRYLWGQSLICVLKKTNH